MTHRLSLAAALALAIGSIADAQPFVRIVTGPLVTDGRYSEGCLWNDVDGDGSPDLAVTNIISQNNLLYLNDGAGSFTQELSGDPVVDGGFSYGGSFADFTGDGWPDLVVVNGGGSLVVPNFFYVNDGAGILERVTTGVLVTDAAGSWSACPADVDGDGHLDLFVANFGQNNALYRNLGGGVFEKILAGDAVTAGGASLGSAFGDYDDDGDPDLFVANANFGAGANNFLYRNDGGSLVAVVGTPVTTDGGNSVGGSWGDLDGDLDLDLFVTNYSGENDFLYRNEGAGVFVRIVTGPVVTSGGASVCGAFGDSDNDGDLDLFVSRDLNESNAFFLNDGSGGFTAVVSGPPVGDGGRSNGSTWCDVDADGDLDLFVTNGDQPVAQSNYLYRNDLGPANAWLSVTCVGTVSNPSAIGTRVEVEATIGGTSRTQMREVSGQTGYNAQSSLAADFGLGDASVVTSLSVRWPSGLEETYTNLPVRQHLTIVEGDVLAVSTPASWPGPRLAPPAPNPSRGVSRLGFTLARAGEVRLALFDARGREVRTIAARPAPPGANEILVDTSGLPPGIYGVRLTTPDGASTRRLTVLR